MHNRSGRFFFLARVVEMITQQEAESEKCLLFFTRRPDRIWQPPAMPEHAAGGGRRGTERQMQQLSANCR